MDGMALLIRAAANGYYRTQTELHLSTLGGLHVIYASEQDPGNVFQSTIRGRWGMRGVFYVETASG